MTDDRKIITWEEYLLANDWWPSDEITNPGTKDQLWVMFNKLEPAPRTDDWPAFLLWIDQFRRKHYPESLEVKQ
jgi:hypothetical protein